MKITRAFIDQCAGLEFNADMRCFTDPENGTNWWIDTQRTGFSLINRDIGVDVDAEFAAACLSAIGESGGALVGADGRLRRVTIQSGRPEVEKG